jgi:hypothetical protein
MMPPVRIVGGIASALLVICAQLSLFALWYLTGQGLSLWVDKARGQRIEAVIRRDGYGQALRPATLRRLLPMNNLTVGCLIVCLVALLLAYWRAVHGSDPDPDLFAYLFGAIAAGLLATALTKAVIDGLIEPAALTPDRLSAGARPSPLKALLALLLIPAIGIAASLDGLACVVGVRGAALAVDPWALGPGARLSRWQLFFGHVTRGKTP